VIAQYYNHAKNMTDLNWQPLLGATVITKAAWEKIPDELHGPLLAAAQEAGRRLQEEIRRSGERDVEAMKKRGLNVVAVDSKTHALWRKTAEVMYSRIRGAIVPAEAFDEAQRSRDQFRARGGAEAGR
jgi:TRAP-type C4-dicarboxylate transport system substrate-binding protein